MVTYGNVSGRGRLLGNFSFWLGAHLEPGEQHAELSVEDRQVNELDVMPLFSRVKDLQ